jgi:hypothetical protein
MNSFSKVGNAPYCLVKYQEKIIDCSYNTIVDCRNQFETHIMSICVSKKDLNLKGDN